MRGRIAIQGNLLGDAPLRDRLLQEPLGCGHIAPFTQEKVNGLPVLVDPPIEIDPVAFHLSICFVDAPGGTHRPSIALPALHKVWHVPPYPAHDSGVRYIEMSLRHHFHEVSITQLVGYIPANT